MLKPVGDRVVVTVVVAEVDNEPVAEVTEEVSRIIQSQGTLEKTAGGIVVANSASKEKPVMARVEAVGPEVGQIKAGDPVLVQEFLGVPTKIQGTKYLIFHEKDVLVIVKDDE